MADSLARFWLYTSPGSLTILGSGAARNLWIYRMGGFMRIEKWVVGLTLLALPTLSFAAVRPLPEPETLGLIAGAAIAWAIVRWKKRK